MQVFQQKRSVVFEEILISTYQIIIANLTCFNSTLGSGSAIQILRRL